VSARYRSKLSPDFVIPIRFHYAVTQSVQLPVIATDRMNYLVLAGVPTPRDAPPHGCVAHMDGFAFKEDALDCLGSANVEGFRRLNDLPEHFPDSCRLIDVAEDVAVEAVSIYQPKGTKVSNSDEPARTPVDVRVSKAGPVLLVLDTHDPATWRVAASKDTRIVGVLLAGVYANAVEGLAEGTPVFRVDSRAKDKIGRACEALYHPFGGAFHGGPAALVLDRRIRAFAGRGVDRMHGAYALADVDIR
jgi:hypothetical protein